MCCNSTGTTEPGSGTPGAGTSSPGDGISQGWHLPGILSPSSSGPNRAPASPTLGEGWEVEGALKKGQKKGKKKKSRKPTTLCPARMATSPVPVSPVAGVCVTPSPWERFMGGAGLGALGWGHPGAALSLPLSPTEAECVGRGILFDPRPPQKGSSCTPAPALPPGKGTWPLPSLFCLGFYYFPFSESKNSPCSTLPAPPTTPAPPDQPHGHGASACIPAAPSSASPSSSFFVFIFRFYFSSLLFLLVF